MHETRLWIMETRFISSYFALYIRWNKKNVEFEKQNR